MNIISNRFFGSMNRVFRCYGLKDELYVFDISEELSLRKVMVLVDNSHFADSPYDPIYLSNNGRYLEIFYIIATSPTH